VATAAKEDNEMYAFLLRRLQGYKKQLDECELLTAADSRCLFGNIEDIYDFSRSVTLNMMVTSVRHFFLSGTNDGEYVMPTSGNGGSFIGI